jgi:hypothetical protein
MFYIIKRFFVITFKVYVVYFVLTLACVGLCIFFATRPPTIGVHVTRDETSLDLPEDATDVCYYLPSAFGPVTAYEFSTREENFRSWAKVNDWPLEPVSEQGYQIYRYTWCMQETNAPRCADIKHGLYHEWNEEDTGRYVAYDRDQHRAYCINHSR